MIDFSCFPRLNDRNHRITSPATTDYSCIAWTAGDINHWWEPGVYWPVASPDGDFGIGVLEEALKALGFEDGQDDSQLDPRFEKVALFGSGFMYTHAARQLANGKWTSKLGREEDIEHDSPNDVAGGVYGEVVQIMKRKASVEP